MEKILAGNTTLYRERCPLCGDWNISGDSIFQCECCGKTYEENNISDTRILAAKKRRKRFSRKQRKEIKEKQNNRCYWCYRPFGQKLWRRGKYITLHMAIDHKMPWAYYPDDNNKNLIGSCHICNRFKHSKIFTSEKECRDFLRKRWIIAIKKKKIFEG